MIALIGAGGHCRSCIDAAESSGVMIGGFVDRDHSAQAYDYPRLGDDSWLEEDKAKNFQWVVSVGQIKTCELRRRLFTLVQKNNLEHASIIARTAYVSKRASLGVGIVVMQNSVINASAKVGNNCIINTRALIEHDSLIEDHCHISTGAIVNGGALVRQGTFVGSGAVLAQGVEIAEGCVIGAGAVVCKNIAESGIWVGNPSRRIG